jgi:hypothetical protein
VSYDAGSKDKRELLSDWVAIMRQLRALGVIRTNNNPIGDIAEAIVCDHYGGKRASFSQKGWDVKAPDGELIQVKSRRRTPESNPTVLSPISDDDYDSLVVVIFDEDFQVTEGLKAAVPSWRTASVSTARTSAESASASYGLTLKSRRSTSLRFRPG